MPRKSKIEIADDLVLEEEYTDPVSAELGRLRDLYTELKELGINSIGDLENKIDRLQR